MKEIKNGRLAMIAIGGMTHHYFLTGKGPIEFITQVLSRPTSTRPCPLPPPHPSSPPPHYRLAPDAPSARAFTRDRQRAGVRSRVLPSAPLTAWRRGGGWAGQIPNFKSCAEAAIPTGLCV